MCMVSSASPALVQKCFCWCVICLIQQSATASICSSYRYFVAFSFDTTLGVSIAIVFHKAAVKWAKQLASRQGSEDISWQKALAECGSYGECIAGWQLRLALQGATLQ